MTDLPPGETPPEPEPDDFRANSMAAEKERKERQRAAFDARSTEAKKHYTGVAEIGDQPGSALAGEKPQE